jgi:hypothetical protein
MSRKIVIAVIAALLLGGTLLLLSGGSGGQSMATPSPSFSSSPTPSGSIDPSLSDLPQPPADPTTSCGFLKALFQSALDVEAFAQAILDGADHESVARAADAYADATDNWDDLAPEIVARDPGLLDSYHAGGLVQDFRTVNDIPRTARYFAQVIRGQDTEFPLDVVAEGLADAGSYSLVMVINGYRRDICPAE